MAILSDSSLLFNHIKNSFIYGDDTGLCELIIEKELIGDYDFQIVLDNKYNIDIVDTSTAHFRSYSPEISILETKPDFSRKLSSDIRIKEVEEESAYIPDNHKFMDTGQWPRKLEEEDIEEYFGTFKEIKNIPMKSLLSKLIEETDQSETVPVNIFSQFARFSALSYTKYVDTTTKAVQIKSTIISDSDPKKTLKDFNVYFWEYSNQRDRLNPVIIRPLADTKVSEFIGLACWKYTDENRIPLLTEKNIVNKLQLYMFEDNDDLELDFGFLHREDPIYKYQFTNLALLETLSSGARKISSSSVITVDSSFVTHSHIDRLAVQSLTLGEGDTINDRNSTSNGSDFSDDSILVQVQLAHGLSKYRFPPDTTMEQIVQRTVTKRHLQQHGNCYKYRLELASDPGKEVDSYKILSEIAEPSFILIRDMSRRKPAIPDSISEESSELLLNMIDLLQPQKYKVFLKQTLRKSEAALKISGEMIEIDVLMSKVPFLIKPKYVRIPIAFLADCVMDTHGQLDTDNSDHKVTLKLVHLKRKSFLVKSLKASREYEYNGGDSESSSGKSIGRYDISSTLTIGYANLLSELTSHSISCPLSKARLIYDKIMSILNLKSSTIRREYLKLSK